MPRTALITGANQGLGRAVAAGLAARLGAADTVLLTGRDPERVAAASAELRVDPATVARVEGRVLDVDDPAAAEATGAELGELDIVVANATARSTPDRPAAEQVDAVLATSNGGTSATLRSWLPRVARGGRFVVVASSLGTLGHLPEPVRSRFAAAAEGSLSDVEAVLESYRLAVHAGTATNEGWPDWPNIPSKVAQVAAVRAVARDRREKDRVADRLVCSVCPGLIDTAASRPWFEDMGDAQSPAQAAEALLDLLLAPSADAALHGELVRFGEILPWAGDVPPAARRNVRAMRIA